MIFSPHFTLNIVATNMVMVGFSKQVQETQREVLMSADIYREHVSKRRMTESNYNLMIRSKKKQGNGSNYISSSLVV